MGNYSWERIGNGQITLNLSLSLEHFNAREIRLSFEITLQHERKNKREALRDQGKWKEWQSTIVFSELCKVKAFLSCNQESSRLLITCWSHWLLVFLVPKSL